MGLFGSVTDDLKSCYAHHMDRNDFVSFYNKYVDKIYKYVFFRVGGSRELAEDLTQDIFTKALDAFDRYDPSISQSAWIYTIARNHIINHAQKQRPQMDMEDAESEISLAVDWVSAVELSYERGRLTDALKELPDHEATLVRMKYLEGWKFADLEDVLGTSSGTLRVQATRILKKLRSILKKK